MEKRGQQMTLGTIIAIVLGIAVLVFLIFGFSTEWGNLWSKVTGFTSDANVQDRIMDCETDCKLGEESAYCNQKKELRFFDEDGKIVKVMETCFVLSSGGHGIEKCPNIKCEIADISGEADWS